MKRILSIVFLLIPLLFFTYACGEETQATVTPSVEKVESAEATKVVEKTNIVVEAVEAPKVAEEKPVAKSTEVTTETESVVKPVAMAASHEEGAKLFEQNCAGCHLGGGNVLNAQKTLKKDALEKYEMYSKEAIVYQVTNGKNAMPAFGKRLTSEQIEQLAEYVLASADKGWSK